MNPKRSKTSILEAINKENSFRLLKYPEIRPIFIFYFFYALGNNAFYDFYPVYFVEVHNFGSEQIAWMTVLLTSMMILSSAFVASHIIKRLGNFISLAASTSLLGLLMIIHPFLDISIIYGLYLCMGFLIALNNTVTPTYMSARFGKHGHGKVLGLQTAVFCLTNVIISIVGSIIAVVSIYATMVLAGLLVLGAISWFIIYSRKNATMSKQFT